VEFINQRRPLYPATSLLIDAITTAAVIWYSQIIFVPFAIYLTNRSNLRISSGNQVNACDSSSWGICVSLRWKQARRVPTYPHIRPTLFWIPAYSKEIPSWSLLIPHTCQWRVLVRGRRKTKKDSQLTILSHRTMRHLLGLGQFRAIWRYLDSYPHLPFLFIVSYLDEFINSCICSQTLKFASEENGWQWLDETPILTREKSTSSS
jgi:hypothetical protein